MTAWGKKGKNSHFMSMIVCMRIWIIYNLDAFF
jgi:hypothetical protein